MTREVTVLEPRPLKKNTSQIRRRTAAVEQNLAIMELDEGDIHPEVHRNGFKKTRTPYASMQAHRETAATYLAAGASYEMAGAQAGVSERQVRKYMADSDFRARIAELRDNLLGQVKGRIIAEFERRTEPEQIKKLEIMDLARIFDRTTGVGVGSAEAPAVMKYDAIIQSITNIDARSQSIHFPEYGDEELPVSNGSTQEPRQVSPD